MTSLCACRQLLSSNSGSPLAAFKEDCRHLGPDRFGQEGQSVSILKPAPRGEAGWWRDAASEGIAGQSEERSSHHRLGEELAAASSKSQRPR